jgi:diacylglycerol kinase family enzyme
MSLEEPEGSVKMGAIALGSSNDFHKPVRREQQVEGISCKIDFSQTLLRDVGELTYRAVSGNLEKRWWFVNAGIGVTAEANDFFNHANGLFRRLKRVSTSVAILYAALTTIFSHENRDLTLTIESSSTLRVPVTNIGIVKSPHFSGNFCYDSDFEAGSGRFNVHLCQDMRPHQTLYTLSRLADHKFSGLPKTRSWTARRLQVRSESPFAVEFDGEVIVSNEVEFSIADRKMEVCF